MDANGLLERIRGRLGRLAGAALLAGVVGSAHADFTWSGAGADNLWGTVGNWLGGVAPAGDIAGQALIFGPEGAGDFMVTDAPVITGIGTGGPGPTGLVFTNADGSYTIAGLPAGSFTFNDGAILDNDSLFAQTVNVDLVAGGATLDVAASTADLVLGGDIAIAGAELTFAGNSDTTVTGVIDGAGSLRKFGGGRLLLDSANTYTGTTTLVSGTIVVGDDAALGTGDLASTGSGRIESDDDARSLVNDVTIDGIALTVGGSNDLEFAGNLDGAGGLTKRDDGTLRLSGTNTYTGITTVRGGILEVTGGDAIEDDGRVNVTDDAGAELELLADETIGTLIGGGETGGAVNLSGGSLTLADTGTSSFAGDIRGTGGIVLTGDDSVVALSGDNAYSGGTTVSAEVTLGIGSDTALGTGTLTLDDDTEFRAANGDRRLANDVVVNTAAVEFAGDNDFRFDGDVDLSGGSTTFDLTAVEVDLRGVISNGELRKSGDGLLVLRGDNTYTGATNIDEGELRLDGSVAGRLNVRPSGILTGEGRVGGDLSVRESARLEPGRNRIGTMSIDGDYERRAGSTLAVELDGADGDADLLSVGGRATLEDGGAIEVSVDGDSFIQAGDTFTIIEAADGVFDEGAEIDTTSATLDFDIIRQESFENGDESYILQAVRESDAFSSAADPGNNQAIGESLDSLIPVANDDSDGAAAGLLAQLDGLDGDEYNDALMEMSPASYDAVTNMEIDNVTVFTANQVSYMQNRRARDVKLRSVAMLDAGRLASAEPDPWIIAAALAAQDEAAAAAPKGKPWGVWGKGLGYRTRLGSDENRVGYDATNYGGMVGGDFAFSPDFFVGVSGAYVRSDADLNEDRGDADVETFRVGPYLGWRSGGWYVDGSVTVGSSSFDVTRDIPTLGVKAKSDYDGWDVSTYLGTGYRLAFNNAWMMTPSLSLQYSYFDYDGFAEDGAGGADLAVDDRTSDSLRSRLGVGFVYTADGGGFLDVFVGWQQEYLGTDDVDAGFVVGGNPFSVDTGDRDETRIYFGGGLSIPFAHTFAGYLRYEGQLGDKSDIHTLTGGLAIRF